MTDTVTVLDLGGHEVAECLPNLRHRPATAVGEPSRVLQQAWRIGVVDAHGKKMGSHIEWRDVPFDPKAR